MLGFAALTPTYLEHAARMRFGCDRSDFFRDDYVWRATRVCDLLNPLYCGYPSGPILMSETGADAQLPSSRRTRTHLVLF